MKVIPLIACITLICILVGISVYYLWNCPRGSNSLISDQSPINQSTIQAWIPPYDTMQKLPKVAIYGERSSGTNYLESLLNLNFDVEIDNGANFGFKHTIRIPEDHSMYARIRGAEAKDVLFIGIVRDPYDWLRAMWLRPHHFGDHPLDSHDAFLNTEITPKRACDINHVTASAGRHDTSVYKNILDMRYAKLAVLMYEMPRDIKHYLLIRYEDLLNNFDATMYAIREKGLVTRSPFPINTSKSDVKKDKSFCIKTSSSRPPPPSKEMVFQHPDFDPAYEAMLGYWPRLS